MRVGGYFLLVAACLVVSISIVRAEDLAYRADTLGDDSDFTFTDDKNYEDAGAGPEKFQYYPGKGFEKSEVDTDMEDARGSPTYGPRQYACETTNLYTDETGENLKFGALSCRRGNDYSIARFKARGNNDHLIMKNKFGLELTFRRQIIHCIRVPAGTASCAAAIRSKALAKPSQGTARKEAAVTARREAERAKHEAEEERKRTLVVSVQNLDQYEVHLAFHAQDRDNAWPGDDRVYILDDSEIHKYKLSCIPNEKICYGAGRSGNYSRFWGSGVNDKEGCEGCCMNCGGTYSYTLRGGSDGDEGSQSASGGISASSLNEFIGAAGNLAGALSGANGGSSGTRSGESIVNRGPAPPQRPSCITRPNGPPIC